MQDGLSAPLGSPNQWNLWEKKLNKEISKYVSDVLFKDPFHICQPIKQICAGSSFSGFHRWISLNSKGWPKSVHYRKALWLCLIKVHPGSSLFSTLFCTDLDYIPGWVCHKKKKNLKERLQPFFALVIMNCNCPVWISVSLDKADSQLAVPCFGFYIFTYCISDKLAVLTARWSLPNVITFCICSCGWCRDNCRSGCFTLGSFTS